VSRAVLAIVALLSLVASTPARAGSWSLGAQLGWMAIQSGEGSYTTTVLAMPSSALSYQPGLRLGFGDARHTREACFEGGMLMIDEAGSLVTIAIGSFGYQHVFMREAAWNPLANVWAGFVNEGGEERSGISPSLGAGLGVRHVVHEDRGALRFEVRYDYLKAGGPFERPKLATVGFRFGFDLWL